MKVASAKNKGRLFQQWVAKRISSILDIPYGIDESIRSREGGQAGTDVVLIGEAKNLFPFCIECKRVEKFSIPAWIKQAKVNATGDNWLLFCKKSREKPIVIMDADAFFDIIKENIVWRKNENRM